MNPRPLPNGTTLVIRGGRAILPGADWHTPAAADIAIAGDTIADVAESLARDPHGEKT